MTRQILVITDKNGNTKDETGRPFGFFLENEDALCAEFCKQNDLTYHVKEIHICGPEDIQ